MVWKGLVFVIAIVAISSCGVIDRGKNFIPAKKVWPKVKKEAAKYGLDPAFVYAVCHAESSLNGNAETSVARGMMQLTEGAWKDVTDKSYRLAFNWETNVEVGTGYLGKLKGMLHKAKVFTYPRLAASYRYGFSALRRQGFLVSKMKTPKNRIYRKIFAGEIRPVKTPSD